GDDPDGKLFAKFREGLSKWLRRQGIEFATTWSRERISGGQAEVVHCHMLFHLPMEYCTKRKLQVEAAIYRLINDTVAATGLRKSSTCASTRTRTANTSSRVVDA